MTLSICWIDWEDCGISVPILENTYLPWLPCSQTQGFIPAGKSCFSGHHDTEYLFDRWGEVWYISSILENTYLPWLPCSQTQGFIPDGKSCFTGYHDTEYLLDRWGEVWNMSSYSGEYIPAMAAL